MRFKFVLRLLMRSTARERPTVAPDDQSAWSTRGISRANHLISDFAKMCPFHDLRTAYSLATRLTRFVPERNERDELDDRRTTTRDRAVDQD
eukprot:scaffold1026_cov272-Pinguiococcus_pyrenoidosus.AAC.10